MSSRVVASGTVVETRSFEAVLTGPSGIDPAMMNDPNRRLSPSERMRKEAYEAAYAEGYRLGHAEGTANGRASGEARAYRESNQAQTELLERFAEELDNVTTSVMEALTQWYAQAEESLGGLAMIIAERVVRKELRTSTDVVLSIARDALLEVTHAANARIRVNPFEAQTLKEHREQLLQIAPSIKNLEIVEDTSIPGGCVIETDGGLVDANIATKLAALAEAARRIA